MTTLATTPVSRDLPYLYVDSSGNYHVFEPSLRTNSAGPSWANGPAPGTSVPMSQFFVVTPSNTAAQMNAALALVNDIWAWRADHGNSGTVGWTVNTAQHGVVVNGNNVLATGLFVEHYQNYDLQWLGNGGETIFFQNEMPYDPPNQAAWMNFSSDGYAAYEVGPNVTSHQAYGPGSYRYFNVNPPVVADHAFETPNTSGVQFHDILTVSLGGVGVIEHVINETGGATPSNTTIPEPGPRPRLPPGPGSTVPTARPG